MNCREEGILLVDKPEGLTSHDVVDFARRKFGFKKVGHAGTLDPMATGLLIILLGGLTKKSFFFLNHDKEYVARLLLGISTDTADREGRVTGEADWRSCAKDAENIRNIFMSFRGELKQVPPMYSAKKIKGRKLYELARKGMVVAREAKTIFIREIDIRATPFPYVDFYVRCSKGTYIRQLAHDIGERIGCGAHLVSLRRTRVGPFDISDAVCFEKLSHENILQPEELPEIPALA